MEEQRDGRSREPHVWAPPDAGASADAAVGRDAPAWPGGTGALGAPEDGPPPPPWERRRRMRRRWLLGLAAALVLAVPLGLAVASTLGAEDDPPPAAEGEREDVAPGDPAPDGDGGPGLDDRPLDAPDLDLLEGPDAVFAQLLLDIDRSEQVMLGFQRELRDIFQAHGFGGDTEELFASLSAAGTERADELRAARGPLEQPVGDVRAEEVREIYLEHLDSWVRYMQAVGDDPTLLASEEGESARYTLTINATADAFARSLEEQLPDDADPEVQRMASQLLDRGFRPQGESDV